MHDRMIVEPTDVASGSIGMPPVRALGERPPLAEVAEADRMVGRREHQRARIDHVREHSGIILRIGRDLGDGDVAGSLHELPELPVRHGMAVHPEAIHGDAMRRGFFRIMLVRAHAESAAGYPDHRHRFVEEASPTVASALNVVAGKSAVISSIASQSIAKRSEPDRATLREEATHRILDPGPISNPSACSATVARMRRILMIQTQEGAAEHGGALEAGKPTRWPKGQHDCSRQRARTFRGGNIPMDCHR